MKQDLNIYKQAIAAYTLNNFLEAERLCLLISTENQNHPSVLILLGNIHKSQKHYTKAIKCYKQAIKQNSNNIEAYNNLGVLYKEIHDYTKAIAAFKQGLSIDNTRKDILYNLGNLYKTLEKTAIAEKYYKKVINLYPDYTLAYNNLGTLYEKKGDLINAQKIYKQGLIKDKNSAIMHFNLGISYQELDDISQAEYELKQSLKFRPEWSKSLTALAEVSQFKGNFNEADTFLNRAINQDSHNTYAKSLLANLKYQIGEKENGIEILKDIIKENPYDPIGLLGLSQLYIEEHKFNKAHEMVNRFLEKEPNNFKFLKQKALILFKKENFEKSLNIYSKLLKQEASDLEILLNILLAEIKLNRFSLDSSTYHKFKKEASSSDILLLATTLFEHQSYNKTLLITEELLSSDPTWVEAQELKIKALQKLNRDNEANKLIDNLNQHKNPSDELLSHIAETYLELGEQEKASQALEKLITSQGQSSDTNKLDKLLKSLDLREKIMDSFEQGQDLSWKQNINLLKDLFSEEKKPLLPKRDPDLLEEEDHLSLLDIEAMEPVININEEIETLYLDEELEDINDFIEENIEEETPAPPQKNIEAHPSPSPASPGTEGKKSPEDEPIETKIANNQEVQSIKEQDSERDKIVKLLSYLFDLSHSLPDSPKKKMIDEEIPLKLASLIKQIEGGKNLRNFASQFDRRLSHRDQSQKLLDLKKTMKGFEEFACKHPDRLIQESFKKKIDNIIRHI